MLKSFKACLGAGAAATVALLFPAAASAYEAEDYSTTISAPSPVAGEPLTVTTRGPAGNPKMTLTITSNPASIPASAIEIAGTKSFTSTTMNGVAEFRVTLHEAGKYTIVPTDVDGVVLSTQTVTVTEPAGSVPDEKHDGLPTTGSQAVNIALVAGGLVAVGGGAVLGVRAVRARRATA